MIAPMAEAANVTPNDSPAAKPAAGAKNVLIIDAKTTDSIFQCTISSFRPTAGSGEISLNQCSYCYVYCLSSFLWRFLHSALSALVEMTTN